MNIKFIILFISIYTFNFLAELYLERMNIKHIRKNSGAPPELFKDSIDLERYKRSISYTVDTVRFSRLVSYVDFFLLLFIIYTGTFNRLDIQVRRYGYSELHTGVIFFVILAILSIIRSAPVSFYSAFVIEKKYGFNTQTVKLWIADLFKSSFISLILSLVVSYGLLYFMLYSGKYWWIYAWGFIFGTGLTFMKIFPVWIAPLFNKFEEINEGELYSSIKGLTEKAKFTIKNIFKVDAGKRSKHSNAYFIGIGKSKRVVLYDTLIDTMTVKEIIAILAHEIGHYKFKHILKGMIIVQIISFLFFFVLSILIKNPVLYKTFMIENYSVYMGIILLAIIWSTVSFWITPFFTWFSRRNEFQADEYALRLCKDPEIFKSLFIKLSIDNLSNLTPHPLYSKFYYSHPPVIERISRIESPGKEASE